MTSNDRSKLDQLLEACGVSEEDYCADAMCDSVIMGICMNPCCSYTREVETDASSSHCEVCNTATVRSGLVILGLI